MTDARAAWLEKAMSEYETSLVRMCYAYLGDSSLAEDAVQETFVKAYKGYHAFRADADEKTWLMRIAINTCKDIRRSAYLRHTDRQTALEDLPEGSEPFSAQDDTLARAVMALRPRLREAVLLRYSQDMSAPEGAQALGMSRAAVYSRLEKAHAALRETLGEWYHE